MLHGGIMPVPCPATLFDNRCFSAAPPTLQRAQGQQSACAAAAHFG